MSTLVGNIKGPQGDTGPSGISGITFKGPYAGGTAYVTNDAVLYQGSVYITSGASTGTVPTNDDGVTTNSPWSMFVAEGAPGATGSTGASGSAGSAATVAVHSTTTGNAGTSATVTNVGSSSAASLDFVIPRGDVGATGSAGSAGARGSLWFSGAGAPGTIGGSATGDYYLNTTNGDVYTL